MTSEVQVLLLAAERFQEGVTGPGIYLRRTGIRFFLKSVTKGAVVSGACVRALRNPEVFDITQRARRSVSKHRVCKFSARI